MIKVRVVQAADNYFILKKRSGINNDVIWKIKRGVSNWFEHV